MHPMPREVTECVRVCATSVNIFPRAGACVTSHKDALGEVKKKGEKKSFGHKETKHAFDW